VHREPSKDVVSQAENDGLNIQQIKKSFSTQDKMYVLRSLKIDLKRDEGIA